MNWQCSSITFLMKSDAINIKQYQQLFYLCWYVTLTIICKNVITQQLNHKGIIASSNKVAIVKYNVPLCYNTNMLECLKCIYVLFLIYTLTE